MKIIISIMSAQFNNFKSKNRRNRGDIDTPNTYIQFRIIITL
jgi:hypothetical protein